MSKQLSGWEKEWLECGDGYEAFDIWVKHWREVHLEDGRDTLELVDVYAGDLEVLAIPRMYGPDLPLNWCPF